ncbi:MAG: histidinol phosphatase [Sphingobacteriales bacterium]|nr:MAG: histidinol phosphatase [Sphingobacteriales bacterium]
MFSIFKKKNTLRTMEWLAVDIHSHLLPGLDDGSPNIEETVKLIKRLHELGYTRFYCTPHIFTELYPNNLNTILPALQKTKAALIEANLDVTIGAAAEYMVDDTFYVTDDLLTLPGNYILIEMSYLNETPDIEKIVLELKATGYKVILAHPERYLFYRTDKKRLERFKEMGVFFQLNLLSVTGYYGKEVKKAANYLIGREFYDFASSDLHHEKHLDALAKVIQDGSLHHKLGAYPFKNKELFL